MNTKKHSSLDKLVQLLDQGEVVAFPTETVYGLGANAWNASAVEKVFETKGRPADNPLIVHISRKNLVDDFALEVTEEAHKLIKAFWPGPLTLIFKKRPEVLDIITGGLSTVALRWPDHPLAQQLIDRAGPLVAPSANSSGRPSPTHPDHIREDFGENFPILEAGSTNIGLESTVLDISEEPFTIYRPGAIGKEQIEKVIEKTLGEPEESPSQPKSPGTKYTHYAPRADVRWMNIGEKPKENSTLYLFHKSDPAMVGDHIICYRQDYEKMARQLYDRFRQADLKSLHAIAVEPFTDKQLDKFPIARALVNRIKKAMDI